MLKRILDAQSGLSVQTDLTVCRTVATSSSSSHQFPVITDLNKHVIPQGGGNYVNLKDNIVR
jgi:hypothetical protein